MRFAIAAALILAASGAQAGQRAFNSWGTDWGTGSNSASHSVQGYTRNDGSYVNGYHATNPNRYQGDNYGAKGNFNPYNGQTGNGD